VHAKPSSLPTNVAETSLTIDGIYYAIDSGFAKQNACDPKLGMDSVIVMPISQAAEARQRAGQAEHTGPGKCDRLYTEAAYRQTRFRRRSDTTSFLYCTTAIATVFYHASFTSDSLSLRDKTTLRSPPQIEQSVGGDL
jgi:hypothetical protein